MAPDPVQPTSAPAAKPEAVPADLTLPPAPGTDLPTIPTGGFFRNYRGGELTSEKVREMAEHYKAPEGNGGEADIDAAGPDRSRRCRAFKRVIDKARENGLISKTEADRVEKMNDAATQENVCHHLAKNNDRKYCSDVIIDDARRSGIITPEQANQLKGRVLSDLRKENESFLGALKLSDKTAETTDGMQERKVNEDLAYFDTTGKLSSEEIAEVKRQPTVAEKVQLLNLILAQHQRENEAAQKKASELSQTKTA